MTDRIKKRIFNISEDNVKKFWCARSRVEGIKKVCLQEYLTDEILEKRNLKEFGILKEFLPKNPTVFDVGCGIGRWADNLRNEVKFYTGIDYIDGFIDAASQRFSQDKNVSFIRMSATDIDMEKLSSIYDVTIITGCLMYVNDKDIPSLLNVINDITSDLIYIRESVCVEKERLTLNDFYSKDLKDYYSAIYRTQEEYKKFFINNLTNFTVAKTGLLLDEQMSVYRETNLRYWVLKRIG